MVESILQPRAVILDVEGYAEETTGSVKVDLWPRSIRTNVPFTRSSRSSPLVLSPQKTPSPAKFSKPTRRIESLVRESTGDLICG